MRPKKETHKSAKSAIVTGKAVKGFTDEERVAMKERAQELKAEVRRGPREKKADGEGDVLAKSTMFPAYKKAQEALQKLEDMTFSDAEIDAFLPRELKRTSSPREVLSREREMEKILPNESERS